MCLPEATKRRKAVGPAWMRTEIPRARGERLEEPGAGNARSSNAAAIDHHQLPQADPGQCSEKVLDQGQLTIGRGPDNDWVLPDPERLVSSRHCTILNRDGVYYLTDTSTNGVLLVNAGHRLRRGNSEPLQDGETVRLGEYDILVQLGHDIALPGSGNPQTDPFTSFDALMSRQAAGSAPAFAEPAPTPHPAVTAHFQGGSPLDTKPDLFDFLTPPPPGAAPRPDHVPAEQHDFRPPEPVIPPPPRPPRRHRPLAAHR